MEAKYIQGTPEYREWILSQLPPGVDPASLGIPGLVDEGAPPKLGDIAKVTVPTSLSSLLTHGALIADGSKIYTLSESSIDEVSVSEQKVLRTLVSSPVNEFGETESLRFRLCALCSHDTLLVTVGWEGHVRIYQTSDGALKHEGKGTENGTPVTALSVYPDDERFAVVSNSGDLKVFSALSGEELWAKEDAHGTWIQAVCTNTPGSILFSGDDDGLIKAWNANDGKLMFEATVHQGLAICVLLCLPDGRLLVGCADGKLFLCSSEDCAVQSKKLVSDSDVRWMAYSKDVSTLFTSANDHCIKVWRMEDMQLIRNMPGQAGYATFHAHCKDKLIAVTSNTVDIHTVYDWTHWLERSLVSDSIEDCEELERNLKLKMDEVRDLKGKAQALLNIVLEEPLGEEPAALERMAVDNSEKEAKTVFAAADEAVQQAEAGISDSREKGKVISEALLLGGAELLKLREEMYAAESDRFDKAALQAVDELKKAADKCAAAVETITVSLSKLEGAPEMRKRASAGAKIHAARVAARAERLRDWPHDDKLPALENGCKWHFFLSHYQLNGGDQCMALRQSLMEVHPEIKVWYDQVNTPTEAGMKEGVSGSETFLVFLTSGVLTRYFVQLEVRTALALGKPVVLVHETDPRHGYAPIGDLIAEAPEDIRVIFNDSVAVPHYREHEYRKVMLAKILRNAALPIPKQMNLGGGGAKAAPPPPLLEGGGPEVLGAPPAMPTSGAPAYSESVAQLSAVVSSLQEQLTALSSRNHAADQSGNSAKASPELVTRLEALEQRVADVAFQVGDRAGKPISEVGAAVDGIGMEKLRAQVEDLRQQLQKQLGSSPSNGEVSQLPSSEMAAVLEKKMKEQAKVRPGN